MIMDTCWGLLFLFCYIWRTRFGWISAALHYEILMQFITHLPYLRLVYFYLTTNCSISIFQLIVQPYIWYESGVGTEHVTWHCLPLLALGMIPTDSSESRLIRQTQRGRHSSVITTSESNKINLRGASF